MNNTIPNFIVAFDVIPSQLRISLSGSFISVEDDIVERLTEICEIALIGHAVISREFSYIRAVVEQTLQSFVQCGALVLRYDGVWVFYSDMLGADRKSHKTMSPTHLALLKAKTVQHEELFHGAEDFTYE